MALVCLDTQIIQWGAMRTVSDSGSQPMIARAYDFILWLTQQNTTVILPSLIVGELLVPIPPEEHNRVLAQLSSDWMIVDFDLKAALLFAQMRYDKAIKQVMDDIRKHDPYATRKQLIADVMIIATAITHSAEKIYSHNDNFLSLAKGYVVAENFLNIAVQQSFLEDEQENTEE
jgi:succinate dehydrogenase hydrophobic anchor subunit